LQGHYAGRPGALWERTKKNLPRIRQDGRGVIKDNKEKGGEKGELQRPRLGKQVKIRESEAMEAGWRAHNGGGPGKWPSKKERAEARRGRPGEREKDRGRCGCVERGHPWERGLRGTGK